MRNKGSLGKLLGFLFIFVVTFSSLVLVLNLPYNHRNHIKEKNFCLTKNKVKRLSSQNKLSYEERLISPLEEKIKKIDLAILQSVLVSSLPKNSIHYIEIEHREVKGKSYLYQSLEIKGKIDKIRLFKKKLIHFLKAWFDHREIGVAVHKNLVKIKVDGIPTHTIIFNLQQGLTKKQFKKGRLILIIDDIGRDLNAAKKLIYLFGSSVNLSILPYSPHAVEVYNLCIKKKVPTLLHMPMEPITYPETNPGPGALLTNMDALKIKNLTQKALYHFPNILAVNNHMGSKFTQNRGLMRVFLSELKKRNLFFIDSMTTPKSVSSSLGKELGLPVFRRDIFLDNKKDVEDILFQLRKAETYSLKKGLVVVIGHPYKETIEALREWKGEKDPNVRLLSVAYLLKQKRTAF
ncbi:divergent polysaccharide deacetylase family protein [Desulfothermus okinawensis]